MLSRKEASLLLVFLGTANLLTGADLLKDRSREAVLKLQADSAVGPTKGSFWI